MNAEALCFWAFALGIVGSATLVIMAKNPVHSAMSLVGCFFFLAGTYALLWAHTIAVLQVLVYAGAIMVLFLFVIMLLSLAEADLAGERLTWVRVVGGVSAGFVLALLCMVFLKTPFSGGGVSPEATSTFGTLAAIGQVLYTQYLLPFEAVSLLLLASIVGAVVVAKARI